MGDITRETYFCIAMDREHNGPVIVASPDGGVDIEEVAEKTPERIKKMPVDIHTGVTDAMATELAEFLGFKGHLVSQCAEQIKNLYKMFLDVDCLQLEVNPLAETPQGKVYTADAKLGFDDNASFRQKAIFDMEDTTESDPRKWMQQVTILTTSSLKETLVAWLTELGWRWPPWTSLK